MKKIAFVTEREAKQYITEEFGADAYIVKSTSDLQHVDENNIPFSISGDLICYDVVDFDTLVIFYESEGTVFTVKGYGEERQFDSLYFAREYARSLAEYHDDDDEDDLHDDILIIDETTGDREVFER